ncbi:unnamed protein product [Rotaria socialis]|uniref:Uncharacterized protein n=1 Tax=Rotaria socialis TaxID=392032 RepID=A0A817TVF1_9BILA|nr:unnamed protein product [Rotaria socialis]CAF3559272.1 unnamed protein product [Rotaria socialis]CAF3624462.1 unnamed protein product [Rotaria socialis]CAF3705821.1 unnamed protein product [Rotaria socialis]CAF3709436.1 unnamed protein product [Rotaria socialis]
MDFLSNLFGQQDSQKAHEQVFGGNGVPPSHHSSLTHEIIAGAAGFDAMKSYEDHVSGTGQPVSHSIMKELLAGFAAAAADKLFETKGLDFLDREETKGRAVQQAHHLAEQQYGPEGTLNP